MFLQGIKGHENAVVSSVTQKEKAKERPIALNTLELMRVASAGLNMSPHSAMQLAEKLYTQGFISYPRTESTQYAENFDLKDVLRQQQNNNDWGADVKELLAKGINKPRKGHDAGDHPPITPTRYLDSAEPRNIDLNFIDIAIFQSRDSRPIRWRQLANLRLHCPPLYRHGVLQLQVPEHHAQRDYRGRKVFVFGQEAD
jgi:reverse gyrase